MSGLAKRIRQARESKNLSLEDVERTLRIRRRYLMAIEAGDYGRLPDGPASRGFVKNFARHVGIDPEEALSLFEAEFGIPELHLKEDIPPPPEREQKESEYTRLVAPDLRWTGNIPSADSAALDNEEVLDDFEMGVGVTVPEISRLDGTTGRAVVIRPHREPRAARSSFRMRTGKRVVGLDTDFDPPKRAVNRPSMNKLGAGMLDQSADLLRLLGYIAAGLAGLAVLFFLVLPFAQNVVSSIGAWWNNTPATRVTTAAAATAVIPGQKKFAVTIIPQGGLVVPAATPAAPGAAPAEAPVSDAVSPLNETTITVPPATGGGLQLAIDVRERAPIKVIVDGNLVFNNAPPLGPLPAWVATRSITIESGNAGAFELTVNGERKGSPGQRNERVRVTYALP